MNQKILYDEPPPPPKTIIQIQKVVSGFPRRQLSKGAMIFFTAQTK